jgi:DNA-binding XRE family transcriptional regulator
MLVVTKKPLTSLRFMAGTPARILKEARTRYKEYIVEAAPDDDDEYVDYFETDFAKKMEAKMTPPKTLKTLRGAHGWTQARLAQEVGDVSVRRISDWENGRRAISKGYAKKLAKIFRFPADKFI